MKNSIQYEFAFTHTNQLVSIFSINHENRSNLYICPSCGKELCPRLGDKRIHHFYHKEISSNNSCGIETYLHKVAKLILFDKLKKLQLLNQPYYIKLYDLMVIKNSNNIVLEQKPDSTYSQYNLLDDCTSISLEKFYKNFKPDILIEYSSKEPLFVEILVNHKSTWLKKDKNAVIEVRIKNEDDFDRILSYLNEDLDVTFNLNKFRKLNYKILSTPAIINENIETFHSSPKNHFDGKKNIQIIFNLFCNKTLTCLVQYKLSSILGPKDRITHTNILLNDFYSYIQILSNNIDYCELSTKSGNQKLYIGFDIRIKEIANNQKYLLLKEADITNNSLLLNSTIFETNLSLDLEKLQDNYLLFVSCFIPKDYFMSSIQEMSYKTLKQLIKDNNIGVLSIEKIRKV